MLRNLEVEIRAILANSDPNGHILSRERNDLEFKQSYHEKNWAHYARTMAAFSNNRGGFILFGITDKNREVVGIGASMEVIPQEKLTDLLNNYYAPEILWDVGTLVISGMTVGYFYTHEADNKPIIALKNENSSRINAGDILYRYRANTRKISYPELRKIIDDKVERERRILFEHFETIFKAGTTNVGIINYANGTLSTPNGVNLAIDKKLVVQILKRAKFIKEGSFSDNGGQPVLKISGNLDIAEEILVPELDPNTQYPYTQKAMAETLGLTPADMQALIWKMNLKGQKRFHAEVKTSKSGVVHKFTEYAKRHIEDQIQRSHYSNADYCAMRKEYFGRRV